ncbi:MAG: GNAT family N-acetyltransferase [Candidatus Thermoplasmatota archaeon]|nr:GNAT family N-acetyltransferase [Candidatus Thermoplasmatota archaeon]
MNYDKYPLFMDSVEIIDVDEENISRYPAKCFLNVHHPAYSVKQEWLKDNFQHGLKIKQLISSDSMKNIGFIEYTDGANAWRSVDAKGYLFIHCLWISPNAYKNKGYGSLLLKEVLTDAINMGKAGVAVITSEGSFMTGKDLFEKNGFTSIASMPPSFHLMVLQIKEGALPSFNEPEKQLKKYEGTHIVYSHQCPWVSRSIPELQGIIKAQGLDVTFTELKTAEEAQHAPSVYATFSLINNGRILADHYISAKRFENIIEKELSRKK